MLDFTSWEALYSNCFTVQATVYSPHYQGCITSNGLAVTCCTCHLQARNPTGTDAVLT